MCKIVFSLFLLLSGSIAWSQQGNYLYIDAEKGQPFYLKIKDKVHSSSQSGYIILPGVKENSIAVNIGFPADIYPEQRFVLPLNNSDQGFHLKNAGDAGWELVNLKTNAVIKNDNPEKAKEDTNLIKKTDSFSLMLSQVVNDPAVLIQGSKIKPAATVTPATEPPPPPPVVMESAEAKPDTLIAVHKDSVMIPEKQVVITKPPVQPQEPVKIEKPAITVNPVPVRKLFDQQFEKVYEATYVDGKNDTIKISYPINADIPVQATASAGCRMTANDKDVDNLRVKILGAKTTDEKIATSKTFFVSKCFTVKQIKGLSELFAGDEDKYRLFDTVYPYTADSANFPSLINLLKEDYYRNRFKAIIRN